MKAECRWEVVCLQHEIVGPCATQILLADVVVLEGVLHVDKLKTYIGCRMLYRRVEKRDYRFQPFGILLANVRVDSHGARLHIAAVLPLRAGVAAPRGARQQTGIAHDVYAGEGG